MANSIINVNIIIATDQLMSDYPNPSQDQNNPTAIAHIYQYMVVSSSANEGAFNINGQGTGDLSFTAMQGDVVRFTAVSEYNNEANPVVLYNMFRYGGDPVFNGAFTLESFPTQTIVPASFNPLVLTSPNPSQFFWTAQNTVNQQGTEDYGLFFAVYTKKRGTSALSLYGYFSWDPTITAL